MARELVERNHFEEEVTLSLEDVALGGHLCIPAGAQSIVMFVHGSGSSRMSPRNQYVAKELNELGLGTLLFDLMTGEEEDLDRIALLRFDISFLARRVMDATIWLKSNPDTEHLRIGYFGASTGAAAALVAAAACPRHVYAVVSRGGRPDLAGMTLAKVKAPVLLIVGEQDKQVIDLNRQASAELTCENRIEIIPGATHLFEEPGKLTKVAQLAGNWFLNHMPGGL